MSVAWAQSSEFALPHLAERPRYRSRGVCRPLFAFDFLAVAVAMFVTGVAASFLAMAMSTVGNKAPDDDRKLLLGMVAPLLSVAALLVPSLLAIYVINRSHVRSWIMMVFACIAWAGAYLVGLNAMDFTATYAKAIGGDFGAFAWFVFMAMMVPVAGAMLFQIVCSDAYRVYYEEYGKWGKQHFAFFKMGTAKRVAELLELGNFDELAKLRVDGPNAGGPAWQAFTSMVLTMPDDGAAGPSYLHVKSIVFGGGPLFSTRVHSCLGWASLRHVELKEGEIDKLRWLFPELAPAGAGVVPQLKNVAPLAGRVLGFQGAMSGDRAETANGSFVQKLDSTERRHLLLRFWLGFTILFQLLAIAGFTVIIGAGIGEMIGGFPSWVETVGVGLGLVWMLATMIVGIFFSKTARLMLMRGVKTRPNLRFVPGKESVVLNVEESSTYAKTKFFADDYALANASPAGLDIEFSSFRVHLDPRDARLDYHKTAGGTGLRIFCVFPEGEWSITVSSPEAAMGLSVYMNPRKRAEKLWRRLYDGMTGGAAATSARPNSGVEL
ncbi:hypothetical protein GC173_07130 [bacterium]|nr:hypothetical protein [bacterium]